MCLSLCKEIGNKFEQDKTVLVSTVGKILELIEGKEINADNITIPINIISMIIPIINTLPINL